MKSTMIRLGCLALLIAMSIGTALAQEAEAAEASGQDMGLGLMIGIFVMGGVVIAVLGYAMSRQSSENNGE